MPDMTLEQLAANIERLPEDVTEALKETAHGFAERLRERATQILLTKTHRTGRTARAIRILDQTSRKQWYVQSPGHEDDPANLPMWLEYGTRYMRARAYMRPAADEIEEAYKRDMARVALATVAKRLE
jgi:HK97 gp10 family phage protein